MLEVFADDVKLWNSDRTVQYEKGKDFEVIDGRLKILPGGRIMKNSDIDVTYSACHAQSIGYSGGCSGGYTPVISSHSESKSITQ